MLQLRLMELQRYYGIPMTGDFNNCNLYLLFKQNKEKSEFEKFRSLLLSPVINPLFPMWGSLQGVE